MWMKILRSTTTSTGEVFEGQVVSLADRDARTLKVLGKARALTPDDEEALQAAIAEETRRALGALNQEASKTIKAAKPGKGNAKGKAGAVPATTEPPADPPGGANDSDKDKSPAGPSADETGGAK